LTNFHYNMKSFSDRHWIPPGSPSNSIHHEITRGFGMPLSETLGAFSPAQTRAILIAGVTCASISLLAALIAFQWFAFMKRSFRHHLILLLILSDMWKALWYFIFPIVVFTRGNVDSTSNFCQASGFFIALGTEASDYAILVIALHAALYVFRPPKRLGEGGLYPHRYWIYTFWVILPVLAACLAFTNPRGYITSGTYCALPIRPFWYRLGLSYIPRYIIFIAIFALYGTISAYVHIKFKGFGKFSDLGSSSGTRSRNSTSEAKTQQGSSASTTPNVECRKQSVAAGTQGRISWNCDMSGDARPEWKDVNFITTAPLKDMSTRQSRDITTADFAPAVSEASSSPRVLEDLISSQRKESEMPTLGTDCKGETRISNGTAQTARTAGAATTTQLQDTRHAILGQLRLLFIYPVVYVLMWVFPFVSHCLQYRNYFAVHPPFWLNVVATCSLALQAGADCAVFSWREKPWRRVRRNGGREKVAKERLRRMSAWTLGRGTIGKISVGAGGGMGGGEPPLDMRVANKSGWKRDSHWWEEEGKKRKDSVWLGTDAINQIVSEQEQEEENEEAAV
jgi:G protein-coupled receptor GPR1